PLCAGRLVLTGRRAGRPRRNQGGPPVCGIIAAAPPNDPGGPSVLVRRNSERGPVHWEAMLAELVRTRRTALRAYAYLFALNPAEAEDLVQEALVRTFGRTRSFTDLSSAEGYVRQAIRTSYLDAARRGAGWTARLPRLVAVDGPPSPDDTAVAGV